MEGESGVHRPVLVAGGAGFLGSHLCARLLDDGHEVICVDDFSTGRPANIAKLSSRPRFRFIEHDIREPLDIDVDCIFNLACPAAPPHYGKMPLRTLTTSVQGSLQLLELARRCDAQVLFTSTSEVYGDPQVHPQHESYWGHVNPIGPRACYNEGKRCAESLHFCYRDEHDVSIKIARLFNTYGPNMPRDDGRVVSNYIVAALEGQPLAVHGSGEQTRSFCYVDDMVEALVRFSACSRDVTGPINLGNADEQSVLALAEVVQRLVGSNVPLEFLPLPGDDPRRRRPCLQLAREQLGWRPRVSLEDGLGRTIAYFRGQLGKTVARQPLVSALA